MLGQALDFAVQVRLDPDDLQALDCIAAEVTVGDRKLPPAAVRAGAESRTGDGARIRIVTTVPIDEPVIGIGLSAGCTSKITRRYVVLADPPGVASPAATETAAIPWVPPGTSADPPPAAPTPAVAAATPEAVPPADKLLPSSRSATPAARPPRASARPRPVPPPPSVAAAVPVAAPVEAAAEPPRPKPRPRDDKAAAKARRAAVTSTAAAEPPSRLRMDLVAPVSTTARISVDEAIEAVAQAASATRAAAAAASANAERMAQMERMVEQLRAEAKANRELAAQVQQRLADADSGGPWFWPLVIATTLLAALTAALGWLLLRRAAPGRPSWQASLIVPQGPPGAAAGSLRPPSTADGPPAGPVPTVNAPLSVPVPRGRTGAARAWPPPAPVDTWSGAPLPAPAQKAAPEPAATSQFPTTLQQPARAAVAAEPARAEPVAPRLAAEDVSTRDVSIEELIDLEQQAEFFVVLGQDGAAVELLNEHLRSTGGSSPLPYLKLLEIHHRRGDRKAYDQIRGRFNEHFNAYAPEWGVDPAAGRVLSDYSGVIPRLQQVWARPLDAMAELEALLFRKSRGDLFDLPAYREVLFLYALARDLMDREALDADSVDLLLPLADGSEFSSTAPAPYLGLEGDAPAPASEDYPTMPLDFDLSAIDRPTSIFDPMEDATVRLRR